MIEYLLSRLKSAAAGFGVLIKQSLLYNLMRYAYAGTTAALKDSAIFGWLYVPGKEYSEPFLYRTLDKLRDVFLKFIKKPAAAVLAAVKDSWIYKRAGELLIVRIFCGGDGIGFDFVSCVFLAAVYCVPHDFWNNMFTLAGMCVITFALLCLTSLGRRGLFSLGKMGLPFIVFMLASFIAVLNSVYIVDALRTFTFFLSGFLGACVVCAAITDEKRLSGLAGVMFAALEITSFLAIAQRIMGVATDESLTDTMLNAGMPGRVFASFGNPNNYAEIIVLTLPLCIAFCLWHGKGRARLIYTVALVPPAAALLMTYSRSGWIAFALAMIVFLFLYNKRILPAAAIIAVVALFFLPKSVMNRVMTIGSTKDSSNSYRLYIWDAALRMLKKYWYGGLGLGNVNFKSVYLGYTNPKAAPAMHAHMIYLEVWLETGIIGIVSLLLYALRLVRNGLLSLKNSVSRTASLAIMATVGSLAGMAFSGAAEYFWYYPRVQFIFFVVCGICAAAINIARGEKEIMFETEI